MLITLWIICLMFKSKRSHGNQFLKMIQIKVKSQTPQVHISYTQQDNGDMMEMHLDS